MPKKIISLFFAILIISLSLVVPFSASAYEPIGVEVYGKNCMLASLDTGEVLYSKSPDEKIYPASITKIMTTIIILESDKYNPNAKITLTEDVFNAMLGTGSSVSNLKIGEEITQKDMVYMVLMSSFGDIALMAANYIAGNEADFVKMMNSKAKKLGLKNTHYENCVGLHDDNHYTTVNDIYTLTVYALKNSTFKEICSSPRYTVPATNMHDQRVLNTTNFLIDNTTNYYYAYAKGVKTGFTDEAGRCVVSTASSEGYNYICIMMGCKNSSEKRYEFISSSNLYRWAFKNFSYKEIADTENPVCEIPVNLSLDTDHLSLYIKEKFVSVLPNDANTSTVIIKPHFKKDSVDAPIKKGDKIGTADIIYAERVLKTVDLVAGNDIKSSFLLVIARGFKNIISSVVVKIILIIIGLAVLGFIARVVMLNYNSKNKRKVKYIPYNKHEKE